MAAPTLVSPARSDPAGEIGKHGSLHARAEVENGRTVIIPTFRRIPYQWHGTHYQDHDDEPFLLVQNSGGGFVEGDSGVFRLTTGAGTRLLVTTTEATKFYRSELDVPASETYDFEVGDGALVEYLPDEVIVYAGSHTIRETRFDLAATSSLIAAEVLVAGRLRYRSSERFGFSSLRSRLEVNVAGDPRFLDNIIVTGRGVERLEAAWAGHSILGTVVAVGEGLDVDVPGVVEHLLASAGAQVGASLRDGLFVARILGSEAWQVHDAVFEIWSILRPLLAHKPARRIVKC